MKRLLYLYFILTGLLWEGCSTIDMSRATSAGLKTIQAAAISDDQISQYVAEYIKATDAENKIASGNDPYAVRLERIAGMFNNTDGLNIKVYKTNDVNAFACADGSIRVYSGLMDIMSDEEVLGVIGHEIGHIKLRHTVKAFKRALLTSALRDGIASAGGVATKLSDSQLGALGEALVQSQYSQKQEYEADNYGYNFLKHHGLNPWAMALSFEKLRQLQQSSVNSGGAIEQLFSTHPDLEARIKRMSESAIKDGYEMPGVTPIKTPGMTVPTENKPTNNKWSF